MSYTLLEALMQVHGVSTHEKRHAIVHHVQRKIGMTVSQLNGWKNGIYGFWTQFDTYHPPQALEMVEMDLSNYFDHLSDLVQPGSIYIFIYLCNFNM